MWGHHSVISKIHSMSDIHHILSLTCDKYLYYFVQLSLICEWWFCKFFTHVICLFEGHLCHHCLWDGDRQTRCAVCYTLLLTQVGGGLLSGGGAGGERRTAGPLHPVLHLSGRQAAAQDYRELVNPKHFSWGLAVDFKYKL